MKYQWLCNCCVCVYGFSALLLGGVGKTVAKEVTFDIAPGEEVVRDLSDLTYHGGDYLLQSTVLVCAGFAPLARPCDLKPKQSNNGITASFWKGDLTWHQTGNGVSYGGSLTGYYDEGRRTGCSETHLITDVKGYGCSTDKMRVGSTTTDNNADRASFDAKNLKIKIKAESDASPGIRSFSTIVAKSPTWYSISGTPPPNTVKSLTVKVRVGSATCSAEWIGGDEVSLGDIKAEDIPYLENYSGKNKVVKSLKICGENQDMLNSATLSFSGIGGKEGGLSEGVIASSQEGIGFKITWEDGDDIFGGVGEGTSINLSGNYAIDYTRNSIEFGVSPVKFHDSPLLTGVVSATLNFKVTYD
ncbi:type 1 fimbrial protein [Shewanella algae]|uniref:fimbrial protein n=1 Tax=Shewanella algae TaxID=38313 RepID=UPI001AADEC42|nr:type 1 fimbrial protein [Shewanella algae]MBO2656076.1 type 1 fimbrial protein [Shewanella algae]